MTGDVLGDEYAERRRGPRGRPDAGLRALVRQHLRHVGQWVTIETGMVEQGVPDINVIVRPQSGDAAVPGLETWIECKQTDAWAVKFRAAQVGWITTRCRYGGRVLVFVRRRRKKEGVDELRVVDGQYVRELAQYGLKNVPHALVTGGGPGRWDWAAVERLLRG